MKNHQPTHTKHQHGFTLVELLVVITIISVLTAIGFVGTAKFRERAQVANAVNSLRQIGAAHIGYATENHGAINTLLDHADESDVIDITDTFWGRMQPYLFSNIAADNPEAYRSQMLTAINAIFSTPDATEMTATPFSDAPIYIDSQTRFPYPMGFNENLKPEPGEPAIRMTSVGDPSRTMYCAFGREFINAADGLDYRPLASSASPGFFFLENQRVIICFLDGHVETLTPTIPERFFHN